MTNGKTKWGPSIARETEDLKSKIKSHLIKPALENEHG